MVPAARRLAWALLEGTPRADDVGIVVSEMVTTAVLCPRSSSQARLNASEVSC
jgi:hypothetical protein